jgi:hypothetical protein
MTTSSVTCRRSAGLLLGLTVIALCAALTGCRTEPGGTPVSPEEAARLVVNRHWLDRLPEEGSARFHVLLMLPQMQHSGVYQHRDMWKGDFELFFFKVDGPRLTFDLRGSHRKVATGYRIERLQTGSDQPFDLKLVLDRSPRGPRTFYSFAGRGSEARALGGRQLPPLGLQLP